MKFIPLFKISGEDIDFDSDNTYRYTYDPNKLWNFGGKFVDSNGTEVTDATVKLTADFLSSPENELGVPGIAGFKDAGEYIIHVNLYETDTDYRFEEEVYTIIVEKAQATANMVKDISYGYELFDGIPKKPVLEVSDDYAKEISSNDIQYSHMDPIDPKDSNNGNKSVAYFSIENNNYYTEGILEKEFTVKYNTMVVEYYDGDELLLTEKFRNYVDEGTFVISESEAKEKLDKPHYNITGIKDYYYGQALQWDLGFGTVHKLTVLYTPIEYNITYNLDGGQLLNNVSNPEKYTIESGEILLNEPKKLGYTFVGWSDGVTTYTSITINDDSFECGNKEYVAVYKASKYDLIYYVDGNEYETQSGNTFNESFDLIADPVKEGYTFAGWYIDPECTELYQKPEKWNSTDNPTKLYGKFTINTYTISFEENEGSHVDDIAAEYQTTVTKPNNPTKDGYTFGGWYENADFSGEEYQFSIMPSKDIKLYAKWDAEEYEIIFESNGGSDVATISQPYGSYVVAPGEPTKDGYNFIGWYDNEELSGEVYEFDTMPLGGIKLYAKWEAKELQIDFITNCDETIAPIKQAYGTSITKPQDPAREGYKFIGWDEDGDQQADTFPETMPSKAITFVAIWEIIEYTITYLDELDNSYKEEEEYTIESETILLPTLVKIGYTFRGWFNGDVEVEQINRGTVGDITLTAKWAINQYTITFVTDGGTEIDPIKQDYGTTVTAPADPTKTGYTFAGWDKEIPAIMPAENVTITANWTINVYKLVFVLDNGNENLEYDVEYDSVIEYPQGIQKEGYSFNKWVNSCERMPAGDLVITATWNINSYKLTFVFDNGEENQIHEVKYNDIIYYPATPTREGYTFDEWDSSLTEMPAEDLTITAKWTINQYTITFKDGETVIETITGEYGSEVTAPDDPKKTGYKFTGWDNEIPATMPANSVTITAIWELIPYSITYKYLLDNGTEISIDSNTNNNRTTYDITSGFSLSPVTASGYTFEGWYLDSNFVQGVNKIDTGTIGDLTIYAKFHNQNVASVKLLNNPTTMNYVAYDKFDLTGSKFEITYDNDTTEIVNGENQSIVYIDGRDYLLVNDSYVTVIVLGKDVIISGITVNKKTIDVTVNDYEITYGDEYNLSNVKFNYSYNYNNENLDNYLQVSLNETGNLNVGEYDIIVNKVTHAQYEFNIIKTGKLIVKQKSIENYEFGSIDEQFVDYNISDNPCEPEISLPSGLSVEDVEITYRDNNKLGSAVLVINGKGNYTGSKEITFKISAKEYSISYDYNDGILGEFSNPTTYVWTSGEIKLNNPTKIGYTFVGWTVNEEEVGINYTINNITSDLVITANWTINEYTITFKDGETVIETITGEYGSEVTAPDDPTKTGYTFDGWDKEIPATMPAENVTVTAKWIINQYTITFKDGETVIETIAGEYGSEVTAPDDPKKTGYKFTGWDNEIPATMPAENVTVTAKWNKLSYFAGQPATCVKDGICEYWFDEEDMYSDCYGLNIINNVTIPKDVNAHSYTDENDKVCDLCGFDRTVTYNVVFKDIDGSIYYSESVLENECISDTGLSIINTYDPEVNYIKYNIFKGWYAENDPLKQYFTSSYIVNEDVVFVLDIEEVDRVYTTNINYIDKDGQRNYAIIHTEVLETKFGDDIDTNIRVQDGSLYLLYMSSCDLFNKDHWNKLLNGSTDEQNGYLSDSNNNLNYIAKISIDENSSNGVLNILVLCEQPAAVITNSSSVNWPAEKATKTSYDTDFTIFGDFYHDVTSAINVASSNSSEQFIFIYGQGKNDIKYHSFLPDATNIIKAKTISINDISYAIPQYTLDMTRYILANSNEYTITDNIVLPYLRDYTNSTGNSPIGCLNETTASNGEYTQSYLIIPEGVTIYLEGNIYVGGVAYSAGQNSSGKIGSRSVIMNNGNIIARSGSEIISYGYIRGENGFIELENGSQLVDVFRIYDYAGGTYSTSMYYSSIFPMQVYSFHNVSCDIKINYGSSFLAYASIYASDSFQTSKNITIVGSKGLFELTESSAYIYKSVTDTVNKTNLHTSYTQTSQDKTHREVLDMYGSFKDNSISVNFAGMEIKTSTDLIMPIGMMTINIQSGNSTLSSCSYKFLPGSRVNVMKGATLTISEKVSVAFYGDDFKDYFENVTSYAYQNQQKDWYSKSDKIGSILTVDGTLYVNGSIGGEINSSGTGIIQIKNNFVEVKLVKKLGTNILSPAETISQKLYAIGNINLKPLQVFEKNKQYYYTDAGYWTTLGEHTINFDPMGGLSCSPITFNVSYENGKVITDLDESISLIPTRSYYHFIGWYLENSYLTEVDFSKIYCDITLYAKWEGYKYNISYNIDSDVIMPENYNKIHIYGINTTLPLPTKDGYNFAGWYLTSGLDDEGDRIEYLSGIQYTNDIELYPCWRSEDYVEYEIKFIDELVSDNNYTKYLPDNEGDGEMLGTLANAPSNPLNIEFDGWYDVNGTKLSSDSPVNTNMVLYAKWKCKVTFISDGKIYHEEPVEYGTTVTAPADPAKSGYTFDKWYSDTSYTNKYDFNTSVKSNITLYANFTKNDGGGCFASGTLITLYDGTMKKIEDVTLDDVLMVFDHEKGVYTSAPIVFIENDGMNYYNVITLEFDNGTTTRIIYEHALFNLTLNKYVYITESNYNEFIGHSFAVYDDRLNTYNSTILLNSSIIYEYTGCYSLVTAYYMNNFIDGLFSMPGGITGLFNYFEYDENLKYDETNMNNDINKYGLYTYEDFEDYIPYEVFEYMFPAKYFKVAVGKEMISFEEIVLLIEKYLVGHDII